MNLFELYAKIGLDTKEYESGVEGAKKSANELKSDIMKLANEYKKQGMSMSDAMKRAYSEIDRSQYETTENSEKSAKQFSINWEGAANAVKGVGEKIKNGLVTAMKVGAAAVGAVTAAVVAFAKSSVDAGKQFDEAMSKVAAISGATGDEFDALRAKAMEMGSKTKFSATESAEAFNYMAMAGWKTEDMLNGIEGIMNLAAASGEDLATTSDIVTDALTAFGLSAGDSAHFADILAVASSNANTNVSMMGETFKYVAPVAGALGFSAEDVAEAIGLMANSGIKASQAGTALRSIISRLSTDAGASSDKLGALGTLTEELGVEFFEAGGQARDFGDVLADTRKAWAKLSQEEQINYGNTIAGMEGMSAWMALMNASEADINKLSSALENADGAALDMANTMQDNLAGDITIFKSALEGAQITLSDQLTPALREFVQFGTEGISKLTTAFQEGGFDNVLNELGAFLADGINMITSALPEMIRAGSELLNSFIASLSEIISEEAPELIQSGLDMLMLLMQGLSENAGVISETIATFLSQFAEAITDNKDRIVDSAGAFITSFLEAIVNPDLWIGLADTVISIIGLLASAIENTDWGELTQTLIDSLLNIIQNIDWGELVGTAFELIGAIIGAGGQIIITLGENIWSGLKQAWEDTKKYFSDYFDEYGGNVIEGLLAGIGDAFVGIATWIEEHIVDPFINGFKSAFGLDSGDGKMSEEGEGVSNDFLGGLSKAWAKVTEFFSGAWDDIKAVWDDASPYFERAWNLIKDIFTDVKDTLSGFFSDAWDAIKVIWDAVSPYFEGLWENIKITFSTVKKVLGDYFEGAWKAIQDVWDAVIGYFENIWNTVKGIFEVVKDVLSGDFDDAWQAIQDVFDGWGQFFEDLWSDVKSIFSNAKDTFLKIGSDIVDGIKQGISNAWHTVTSLVGSKWNGLVDGAKGLLGIHSPEKVSDDIQNGLDFSGDLAYNTYRNGSAGNGFNGYGQGTQVVQNIYSQAKTAADLMEEARWNFDMAVAY